MQKDKATYPEFGNIYPGDYYKELPFDRYIDFAQPLPGGEHVFDIRSFGAEADSEYLNTDAFEQAAQACEAAGGADQRG